MTDYASLRRRIEDEGLSSVDFRVSDLVGRLRHLTIPVSRFTEALLREGLGFDGSNYGYRNVAGSDMVLVPDLSTAYVEERNGERILSVIANICEAVTGDPAPIDPRGICRAAVQRLRDEGVADDAIVSPEFEFYLFDRILYSADAGHFGVEIVAAEGNDHRALPGLGDAAHSAYHAPLPQDRLFGVRCEMSRQIEQAGIEVKYHHHEVGPFGQQEIELGFAPLLRMADATFIVKSIVHNAAHESGLAATFLPKPIHGEAGNGMHLHQYLIRDGANQFRGEDGLSELALCYVGGLLTHGRSLMAWTNPSTNSYRRLTPGFEAPVNFVFGSANRSAAVRVPAYAKDEKLRIELRTMDATCNPYLAYAAILMAGLDGIRRGLNARDLGFGPVDANIYEQREGDAAPSALEEALDALETDHEYLLDGGVFSRDGIDQWIGVKRAEAASVSERPHPYEFALYSDL